MHMLEKSFITIIHLAQWKVIAKADVIAVPPGTAGVCGQKHLSYSHRSSSQTTHILCRPRPPLSSRSNASWKIYSSAREPKPLRGSNTKPPVNIWAIRAFLPVLLDTDKQCLRAGWGWRWGVYPSMQHIPSCFLLSCT